MAILRWPLHIVLFVMNLRSPDQRLELHGFREDCDRPDLHTEGEDLVAHLRRGDEETGVVYVGLGDDFVGSCYR